MAKTTRRAMASTIVLGLAVLPWLPAQGATPKTKRVSVRSNGNQGNNFSVDSEISGNGRFVAFRSDATNLVGGDDNASADVFVYDRRTKKTKRVSVRSNGTEGDSHSYGPSISGNGRFVAFSSDATNLVAGDDNGAADSFVHDRRTKKTKRVSVRSNGTEGDGDSFEASISANGRFVTFSSLATNLVAGDDNGSYDVFVHDRRTKKTKRVSVRSNGTEGDDRSTNPSISGDGRFVAFMSDATNLVGGDTNGVGDVFVHDRKTKKTKRVSVRSNGTEGDEGDSESQTSISANGRFVTFESEATNLVGGDTNSDSDVFVHDRKTKKTKRVSVRSNGTQANNESRVATISANGRFVAFESEANNLVGGDTNDIDDVFVHDRRTKKTKRVSVRSNGTEGDDESFKPSISGDGRFVTFESAATNFVGGDTNNHIDIFVRGPLR